MQRKRFVLNGERKGNLSIERWKSCYIIVPLFTFPPPKAHNCRLRFRSETQLKIWLDVLDVFHLAWHLGARHVECNLRNSRPSRRNSPSMQLPEKQLIPHPVKNLWKSISEICNSRVMPLAAWTQACLMPSERARNKRPPRPNPSYPESNFESFEMVPQLSAKSAAAESYLALPASTICPRWRPNPCHSRRGADEIVRGFALNIALAKERGRGEFDNATLFF